MIQKITELNEPPVVGKYYLVPCAPLLGRGLLPITGEAHKDTELNADFEHYHYDVRFFNNAEIAATVAGYDKDKLAIAGVAPTQAAMSRIHVTEEIYYPQQKEIVWKKKLCRRDMPDFHLSDMWKWREFHKQHTGRKVKCGVCPHRKFNLNQLKPDENGRVVCNGHGLLIDMRKGEVLNRFEETK